MLEIVKLLLGVTIADVTSHRKLVQMTSCVCNRERRVKIGDNLECDISEMIVCC